MLDPLEVFETAARHESYARAAEELCVTGSTVSGHVRELEIAVGLKLFKREGQRLVLTEAGCAYLVAVRDALHGFAGKPRKTDIRQAVKHGGTRVEREA
jgi:LysR family glycine cleavage system transcriptional activator